MVKRVIGGAGLTGYWPLGDNSWKDEMDANLRLLSILTGQRVASRTVALPGSPTAGDIYIVETTDPTNGDDVAIFDGEAGSEAWVYIAPQIGWTFYALDEATTILWDGTDWVELVSSAAVVTFPYDLRVLTSGTMADAEVLDTILLPREVTFAANLAGSLGSVGVNPGASTVLSLKDDTVTIGTITISTGGVFTFATTGGTVQVVAAGSVLTLEAPATADTTIESVNVSLVGVTS